jgi:hypothetical protein
MSVDLVEGARNLLINCAKLEPGQILLIILEDPATEFYGASLASDVAKTAEQFGIETKTMIIPFHADVIDPPLSIIRAMQQADRTLFLARMGDQLRFSDVLALARPIVCYALDSGMLSSNFGKVPHDAMIAIKDIANQALGSAKTIEVTCPLGTHFKGTGAVFPKVAGEVTIDRFPLSVFTPIPAADYAGKIAQAGFLTGTGSHYYSPYTLPLEDVLFIHFEGNQIVDFEGRPNDVENARRHYRFVGDLLNIDHDFVHSWHAGIHPGCAFVSNAGNSTERWGGGAFGNPRILHFHTCGNYAPGEISINVIDPTIEIDGTPIWEKGRLHPERLKGGEALLDRYPILNEAFQNPAQEIGLLKSGRLSWQSE